MLTGKNSDEQFRTSGDTPHDSVNGEGKEIKSTLPPLEPFNPLTESGVNEKSYAKPNIRVDPAQANQPIPEPTFAPPPVTPTNEAAKPQGPPQPPPPPVNPQLQDLPKKDKDNAAKVAANMVINGYELANKLADDACQISDTAVKKLSKKGLIDLRIPLQIATGQISMAQFIDVYNEQSAGAFTVSQEFKDEIRPPLERIFAARGIGATDMDLVLSCLGKDLAFKVPRFIQLLGVRRDMITQLKDSTAQWGKLMREQGANNAPQNHNPPPPPPEYRPDPQQPTPPPPVPHVDNSHIRTEVAEVIPFDDDNVNASQSMTLYEQPKKKGRTPGSKNRLKA